MQQIKIVRNIWLGIENLLMHKLRSLLTTLGIVFGVGSVVAMLSVGEGASKERALSVTKSKKRPRGDATPLLSLRVALNIRNCSASFRMARLRCARSRSIRWYPVSYMKLLLSYAGQWLVSLQLSSLQ